MIVTALDLASTSNAQAGWEQVNSIPEGYEMITRFAKNTHVSLSIMAVLQRRHFLLLLLHVRGLSDTTCSQTRKQVQLQ